MGLELSGDHWLLVDWTEQVPIVVELLVLWVKGRDNGESVKTEGISASEVDLKGERVSLLFTVIVFVVAIWPIEVVYCCLQNIVSAPSDNFRYIVRSYLVSCSSSSSNIVVVLLTVL